MLSRLFALFVLMLASDSLAITLLPIPLQSAAQEIRVFPLNTGGGQQIATGATHAQLDWNASGPPLGGSGTMLASITNGALALSFQGSGSQTLPNVQATIITDGSYNLNFRVPDFGFPTTTVVWSETRDSSQVTGFGDPTIFVGQGASSDLAHQPGYFSSILNSFVSLPRDSFLDFVSAQQPSSSVIMTFLAGDMVSIGVDSNANYQIAAPPGTGSFSQTISLHAFAVAPVPEPSTLSLLGCGFAVFAIRAKKRPAYSTV